jgi:16S rRNA processing protein RimM
MKRAEPSYLVVGHVNKPHGTKGELFVWPLTDHPESTFAPGVILYVGDERGEAPDPARPSLLVRGVRPFRRGFLVTFPGVTDRTQAEVLQGRYLFRPRSELEELEEGEVFYHQLVGMRVVTEEGVEVGEVVEVYELRPADLLEVRGPRGVHHIPFLQTIVREMDVEGGVLVIAPPEGLLDLS